MRVTRWFPSWSSGPTRRPPTRSPGIEEQPSRREDSVIQNGSTGNPYYDDIEIEADPSILSSVAPSEVRRQWNCRWGLALLLVGAIVVAVPTGVLVSRFYRNSHTTAQTSAVTESDASPESPTPSPHNVTARLALTLAFNDTVDELPTSRERAAVEQTLNEYFSTNLEVGSVNVSVVDQSLVTADKRRRSHRRLEQTPALVLDLDVSAVTSLSSDSFTTSVVALVKSDSSELTASLQDQGSYFSDLGQVTAQPGTNTSSRGDEDDTVDTAEPTGAPSTFDTESPTVAPTPAAADTLEPTANDQPTESPPTATTANPSTSSGQMCNGMVNLCDVPVNQVMFATLHNAHAAIADGFSIAPNHNLPLEDAVQAGYRGINVDIGKCNGEIALTHSFCFLGTRDAVKVFSWLDTWLDDNPNEVLLLPTQIDNEAGGVVTLDDIYQMLLQSGNFLQKLYVRDATNGDASSSLAQDFPTLQQLIDRNQRILFFPYNGQTCAELVAEQGSSSACPTGFHDWFAYAAETQYSFNTEADVEDESLSCAITRGDASHAFFGVNVFLEFPSQTAASYLNSADFLTSHLQACAEANGEPHVSAVLVDFWDEGDVLQVVSDYNAQLGSS